MQGMVTDWDLNYCTILEGVKMPPSHSATSFFHYGPGSMVGCILAYFLLQEHGDNSNKQTFKFLSYPLAQERVSNQEAFMDIICVLKKLSEYWALCILHLIETQEK